MALSSINAVCNQCRSRFVGQPKRSFLGFQKLSCPRCHEKLTYPLTHGYRSIYRVLFGLMLVGFVAGISAGLVVYPGGFGLAILFALAWDQVLQKRVSDSERWSPAKQETSYVSASNGAEQPISSTSRITDRTPNPLHKQPSIRQMAPTRQASTAKTVPTSSDFDEEWATLIKYDPDFKSAVESVEEFRDDAVQELKRAFRVVGDRSKIAFIAQMIVNERSLLQLEQDQKKKLARRSLEEAREKRKADSTFLQRRAKGLAGSALAGAPTEQSYWLAAKHLGLEIRRDEAGFSVMRNGKQIKYFFNDEELLTFLQAEAADVRQAPPPGAGKPR